MRPRFLHDHRVGFLVGHGRLVHAFVDQCVVDVHHRHQACRQGNGGAGDPLGVAASVPPLVMSIHEFTGGDEEAHRGAHLLQNVVEHVATNAGVGLHRYELLGREGAALVENRVRHTDLANVMKRRCTREVVEPIAFEIGVAPEVLKVGVRQDSHLTTHARRVVREFIAATLDE